MALLTGEAPSTGLNALQTQLRAFFTHVESALEEQRTQLALWCPVMLALGIGLWFRLPGAGDWITVILLGLAIAGIGLALGRSKRIGFALICAGLLTSLGCGLAWARAEFVRAPVLTRPVIAQFTATINRIDQTQDKLRLVVAPTHGSGLPDVVRVSVAADEAHRRLVTDDRVLIRARLMPPPPPAVPGAYDFSRAAWFQGLGATGKALDPVKRLEAAQVEPALRQRLSSHIAAQLPADLAGFAVALASGDQGWVTEADQEALRASGLAHLLSVSGLHISAVVGAAIFLSLRLLALSPALALRLTLPLVAAGVGAVAGIGYTWLVGAQVPTLRSCIAALLILAGMAMGREAFTLRLVAAGALIVLFLWPEALVGASFQLSFAAITALVAVNELAFVKKVTARREENLRRRLGRALFALLVSGIAVEFALMPIALFHFHKSGLYGALGNIIAIPMTTFIIMPLEVLALLLDSIGIGAPVWWLVGHAIAIITALAHWIAQSPGAVAMLPDVPLGLYGLILAGGLWLALWRGRIRLWGVLPVAVAVGLLLVKPSPDILITGDGRHVAIKGENGNYALLRPRAGDYVRDILAGRGGTEALDELELAPGAQCSSDSCTMSIAGEGRRWHILATRSAHNLPWRSLIAACARADLVISDRVLPQACMPRWFRADAAFLRQTGGMAIHLDSARVETVRSTNDTHPWTARR